MSWPHNEHVENWFFGMEPDFPHAWTFSAQRYVPRPRPVARIILPSHQRTSSPISPEVPSYSAAFSRSDSSSLLKFAHERNNLARLGPDAWVHKPWSPYKRLNKPAIAAKEKIVDGLVAALRSVRKGFRLLRKVAQAFKRF